MRQKLSFQRARTLVKCFLVAAVALFVAVLLLEAGGIYGFSSYLVLAGFLCVAAAIALAVVGMRCPYCGRYIIRRSLLVDRCPFCRRDLATGVKSKGKKD